MRSKLRQMALFGMLAGLATAQCGCSVLMETARPGYKDVTVLQTGATRAHVDRYVGEPAITYPHNGGTIEVYRLDPDGQSIRTKIATGALLLTADALTFGVTEAVFTALQICSWNHKVDFIVAYTSEGTIDSVHCAHPDSELSTLMKGPNEIADERQMNCPNPGEAPGAFCEQH